MSVTSASVSVVLVICCILSIDLCEIGLVSLMNNDERIFICFCCVTSAQLVSFAA